MVPPVVTPTMVSKETVYIGWVSADVKAQLWAEWNLWNPTHPANNLNPYWVKKITWSDGSITYALS